MRRGAVYKDLYGVYGRKAFARIWMIFFFSFSGFGF